MKFDCIINMDNDAFADDQHFELSKIIKRIAKEVNDSYSIECIERTKTIWDINGNKVGTWQFKI